MTKTPIAPAHERSGEPFYIDSICKECGTELVEDTDSPEVHDEWMCPECQDGIYLDWPNEQYEEIERKDKETSSEDIKQGAKEIYIGEPMLLEDIETDYGAIVSKGNVVRKKSPHNWDVDCPCSKSEPLAMPRDVVVEYDDCTYHFYHQTPIVVELGGGAYRLTNGDYKTKSTKRKINSKIPDGYKVYQRDFDWYIERPKHDEKDESFEFVNGMVLQT